MTATRAELLRVARNIGVNRYSNMSKAQLARAIAARRAYLAKPAADIPRTIRPDTSDTRATE